MQVALGSACLPVREETCMTPSHALPALHILQPPPTPLTRQPIHFHQQLVEHTRSGALARAPAGAAAAPQGDAVDLVKEEEARGGLRTEGRSVSRIGGGTGPTDMAWFSWRRACLL